MYSDIFFDLDGTLTDSSPGIINSVIYALKKLGVTPPPRADLYKFIGPPLKDSFVNYCSLSPEKALLAVEYYREYFRDVGIFENSVYTGIQELLSKLKLSGKRIILATSKPEEFAVRILKHFNLYDYFDFVGGADFKGIRGEKTDVIAYCLQNAAITDTSSVLMVGDREYDILGAKAFGMDSVGVTYGYGSRAELEKAGATYIAATPLDVLKYI